ncbi:cell division protein ZapA [Alteraurantiacibacter buctensis]|uniref:Cell division protein ZapA n=1 Tax=Alteraurantiacibacter buctensis TaxID=1503981 RepID=A0A844YXF6_9SPHN|nr:cell division protein ZapA [Alteraurantiacibacter buctensis]MXO71640.1 cell division protein ZapA [Alteraurantiacibacter buctensis]
MSNVTLQIGGRRYTIACAPGEEGHIAGLGATINDRLSTIPNVHGQSEARSLLYAALLLADELHEAGKQAPTQQSGAAEPLEKLADRLESLASQLEASAAAS